MLGLARFRFSFSKQSVPADNFVARGGAQTRSPRILSTRSKFEKTRERWQKRTRKGCETVFPEGRRAGSRAFYLGILGLRTSRQEDRCGGSKEQGARSKEQGARNSSSRHRGGCTRTSHVHCVRANWARSMHADAQRAEATEHVQRRATCRQMLSLAAKIRACIILQPALAASLSSSSLLFLLRLDAAEPPIRYQRDQDLCPLSRTKVATLILRTCPPRPPPDHLEFIDPAAPSNVNSLAKRVTY